MAIKTKLFKHQAEAIAYGKSRPYFAFIHECGLGKTLSALGIVDARVTKHPPYKTLVVMPNTLIENWMDEVTMHTDLKAVSVTGTKKQRAKALASNAHLYLINYEGLRVIKDDLIKKKFNLVIFDESQGLKNPSSQQSKAGYMIAMSAPHRIIMTGTPIMNTPLDLFGQYRCLSTDIFGTSYYRFRAMYAIMGGYLGRQVLKYINQGQLRKRTIAVSHMRTKDECLDLPPKLYTTVHVELTDIQKRMYKQLRELFITSCNESIVTAPVMLTRLMRFSQITAGFYKDIEGKETSYEKNPKQEWLIEWLKENKYKTVVFVKYIKELKDLEAALQRSNIGFTSIYGATKERISKVKHFNSSPLCQVLIGQLDTAGEGINLQSAAYCVFLSNGYSYGKREQAESRIHRSGQTAENCTFIDVVARGTIDEHVLRTLKKKKSLAGMLASELQRMV